MKRIILAAVVLLAGCATEPPPPVVGEIKIIPQPLSIKRMGGTFTLRVDSPIVAVSEAEMHGADALAAGIKERIPGIELRVTGERGTPKAIEFTETPAAGTDARLDSAYRLTVTPDRVIIAGTARGMFYGVQSLLQLLPPGVSLPAELPSAEIDDRPRFEYRGMHLDVARHFMPVEFIKRYIDHLARYKLNYFHWHLTDDQGWRIEIEQYPRLTEKGSDRTESALSKANEPYRGNGRRVRGYYTKEHISEIVEHARMRHVTIIPEIDMPGHSAAALAAYPEYGCRGPSYKYKVRTEWGAFPDILCPTPETFVFVENVLAKVIDLFPDSPYIHIGGDEVVFHDQWRSSGAVQQLKAAEGLKSERDVEAYFFRRVAEMLTVRGRTAIGWDEVIDRPANGITVMAWQGPERGRLAAAMGNKVIMTPWQSTYFDHLPGDLGSERVALGDPVPLEAVYAFDPAPREFGPAAKNVIGGQACLWTEFVYEPTDVEYLLFPRLLALSESLWTVPESKNLDAFYRKMTLELARLDQLGTTFYIPAPLGFTGRPIRPNERAVLDLLPPVAGASIYYTQDGSPPGPDSSLYRMPLILDGTEERVRALIVLPSGRKSAVFEARFSSADNRTVIRPVGQIEMPRQTRPGKQVPPDPVSVSDTSNSEPKSNTAPVPRQPANNNSDRKSIRETEKPN